MFSTLNYLEKISELSRQIGEFDDLKNRWPKGHPLQHRFQKEIDELNKELDLIVLKKQQRNLNETTYPKEDKT